eukprot:753088-Hanusia_phi.AAC.13
MEGSSTPVASGASAPLGVAGSSSWLPRRRWDRPSNPWERSRGHGRISAAEVGEEKGAGGFVHLKLEGIMILRAMAKSLISPPPWVAKICWICSLGSEISKDDMLWINCMTRA